LGGITELSLGLHAEGVKRGKFYWGMSALLLLIVLAGFSRSFYLRPLFDVSDSTLPNAYIHGAIMTLWYAAFFFRPPLPRLGTFLYIGVLGRTW
jgi:hypothetical protein